MRITSIILRTLAIVPLMIELVVRLAGYEVAKGYAANLIVAAWLLSILSLLILSLVTKKEKQWNLLTCVSSMALVIMFSVIDRLQFGRE